MCPRLDGSTKDVLGTQGRLGPKPHTQPPGGGRQHNTPSCGHPRSRTAVSAELEASYRSQWTLHLGHVAGTWAVPRPQT